MKIRKYMFKFILCFAMVISTRIIFCIQNELDQHYLRDITDSLQILAQITPQSSNQEKNRLMQEVSAKLENLKAVMSQDMRQLPSDDPRFGGPVNNKVN